MDNFEFIGITEAYEEDLEYFAQTFLDGDRVEPQRLNVGNASGAYQIDKALRKKIEAFHDRDMKLYQDALRRRQARFGMPKSFTEKSEECLKSSVYDSNTPMADYLAAIREPQYLRNIQELAQKLAQKEVQMAEVVSQRDYLVAQMGEVVPQRDQLVAQMGEVVPQRDQLVAQMAEVISQRDQMEKELEGLRGFHDSLQQSLSWKMTRRLAQWVRRAAPADSLRRRVLRSSGDFCKKVLGNVVRKAA